MKTYFTFSNIKTSVFPAAVLLSSLLMIVTLAACSSSAPQNGSVNEPAIEENSLSPGEQSLSFYAEKEGKNELWKAVVKDGKIIELSRAGKQIPEAEFNGYKDFVYNHLDDLRNQISPNKEFSFHFKFDSANVFSGKNFKKHMMCFMPDSCWKGFDSEKFNRQMEKLGEKLKNMKIDIEFDSASFNSAMAELSKALSKLGTEKNSFDWKEFSKKMKEFSQKMKEKSFKMNHFKIDLSGLDSSMHELSKNMKELKTNMKDLKCKMKKLNVFTKDVRSELFKDGYLKNLDDNFTFTLKPNEMTFNGNKMPDKLLPKYKNLYKKDFGREIKKEFKINTK